MNPGLKRHEAAPRKKEGTKKREKDLRIEIVGRGEDSKSRSVGAVDSLNSSSDWGGRKVDRKEGKLRKGRGRTTQDTSDYHFRGLNPSNVNRCVNGKPHSEREKQQKKKNGPSVTKNFGLNSKTQIEGLKVCLKKKEKTGGELKKQQKTGV